MAYIPSYLNEGDWENLAVMYSVYTSTVCLFVAMITVAIKEVPKAINLSITCTETYVFEAFSDGSLSIFLCVVSIERSETKGLGKTGKEGERKEEESRSFSSEEEEMVLLLIYRKGEIFRSSARYYAIQNHKSNLS